MSTFVRYSIRDIEDLQENIGNCSISSDCLVYDHTGDICYYSDVAELEEAINSKDWEIRDLQEELDLQIQENENLTAAHQVEVDDLYNEKSEAESRLKSISHLLNSWKTSYLHRYISGSPHDDYSLEQTEALWKARLHCIEELDEVLAEEED